MRDDEGFGSGFHPAAPDMGLFISGPRGTHIGRLRCATRYAVEDNGLDGSHVSCQLHLVFLRGEIRIQSSLAQ